MCTIIIDFSSSVVFQRQHGSSNTYFISFKVEIRKSEMFTSMCSGHRPLFMEKVSENPRGNKACVAWETMCTMCYSYNVYRTHQHNGRTMETDCAYRDKNFLRLLDDVNFRPFIVLEQLHVCGVVQVRRRVCTEKRGEPLAIRQSRWTGTVGHLRKMERKFIHSLIHFFRKMVTLWWWKTHGKKYGRWKEIWQMERKTEKKIEIMKKNS